MPIPTAVVRLRAIHINVESHARATLAAPTADALRHNAVGIIAVRLDAAADRCVDADFHLAAEPAVTAAPAHTDTGIHIPALFAADAEPDTDARAAAAAATADAGGQDAVGTRAKGGENSRMVNFDGAGYPTFATTAAHRHRDVLGLTAAKSSGQREAAIAAAVAGALGADAMGLAALRDDVARTGKRGRRD
ncbi:hypothetical protein B1C78_16060 [Thioalkalivibrio denitrificans]|uniref:Uncharacterized protein n=1 Tax=Thioalkalivibrio denitrificans TaxID=108003 RepID=A0A1V3N9B6_9GAMM|nr:hypothetical protein B1C78_16060 [Thioalkalivibrio denitrificans]